MSQQLAADFNIDPDTTSGPELADLLNRFNSAMLTMRSGTSRPPSAEAGTTWLDTTSATDHIAYFYDGTTDIKMFTLKVSSNTIIFEDSYLTAKDSSFAISLDGSALANDDSTDNNNLAIGAFSANRIFTGSYNTALGQSALRCFGAGTGSASNNVAIGAFSGYYMDTGANNVHIGRYAGAYTNSALSSQLTSLSNTICIGQYSYATASGEMSLGNSTHITTAFTAATFTQRSDERLKDFHGMDLGLDFINALQPNSYSWKKGPDTETIHYGFSAQKVKATLDNQVGSDKRYIHQLRGDEENLAYTEFVAPLVKAVQELSAENQQLKNDYNSLLERVIALENK